MSNQITNETLIDVFKPPEFEPYAVKAFKQAVLDGEWIGVVSIWVVREIDGRLEVLFQKRPDDSYFAPSKFDVAAGGHYTQGQHHSGDHLREAKEELGIELDPGSTYKICRRLVAVVNQNTGRERKLVCDIYLSVLEPADTKLNPPEDEVYGLVWVPMEILKDLYARKGKEVKVDGVDRFGKSVEYALSNDSFVYNFDDFHENSIKIIDLWHQGLYELEKFKK